MKISLRVVTVAALCLAAVIGCVSALQARPEFSAETMVQARNLSGRGSMSLVRPSIPVFESGEPMNGFVDKDSGDEFWAEESTGQVRRYANTAAYEMAAKRDVDSVDDLGEKAIGAKARGYMDNNLGHLRATRGTIDVERMDGGNEVSYLVQYREYIGPVRTFNYACMTFTPDGILLSTSVQDFEVEADLKPTVSESEALKKVADAFKLKIWSDENCELTVTRSLDGAQRLCWAVRLQTGNADFGGSYVGIVDAHDGSIVELCQ
ncbi:MAG: hypothetical protein Q8K99_11420 [Actinomycetota bacterium]|nr:hypothetical protein [Actinomycetota bacterium]